jgi:23S rRNA (adenine2503-C2)-methyltransferase
LYRFKLLKGFRGKIMDQFCGVTYEQLSQFMTGSGFGDQYALKAVTNYYRKGISDFKSMDNIPKAVRELLGLRFQASRYSPVHHEESSDRSVRYLFTNNKGMAYETVFIPDGKRRTVCVSTQSGCRMGCPFCLTGRFGFKGDLSAGEIVGQVMSIPYSREITHVVFMGMGEPLDNTEEVLKACSILTSSWGLAISPGNVTVSTVGITPGVKRFLGESVCNLALSLFSPFAEERAKVVPAERKFPAREIIRMLREYPTTGKRRFTIAYVMIAGMNDTESHLDELTELLKGTKIRVNLLRYHATGQDNCTPSSPERMEYFLQKLTDSGISASVRKSRGADISAACGLLAAGLKK